jgi:hypothetical protein
MVTTVRFGAVTFPINPDSLTREYVQALSIKSMLNYGLTAESKGNRLPTIRLSGTLTGATAMATMYALEEAFDYCTVALLVTPTYPAGESAIIIDQEFGVEDVKNYLELIRFSLTFILVSTVAFPTYALYVKDEWGIYIGVTGILDLTVEPQMGGTASSFSFVLNNQGGQYAHPIFDYNREVKISIGYSDTNTVTIIGIIDTIDYHTSKEAGSTVTVTGRDFAARLLEGYKIEGTYDNWYPDGSSDPVGGGVSGSNMMVDLLTGIDPLTGLASHIRNNSDTGLGTARLKQVNWAYWSGIPWPMYFSFPMSTKLELIKHISDLYKMEFYIDADLSGYGKPQFVWYPQPPMSALVTTVVTLGANLVANPSFTNPLGATWEYPETWTLFKPDPLSDGSIARYLPDYYDEPACLQVISDNSASTIYAESAYIAITATTKYKWQVRIKTQYSDNGEVAMQFKLYDSWGPGLPGDLVGTVFIPTRSGSSTEWVEYSGFFTPSDASATAAFVKVLLGNTAPATYPAYVLFDYVLLRSYTVTTSDIIAAGSTSICVDNVGPWINYVGHKIWIFDSDNSEEKTITGWWGGEDCGLYLDSALVHSYYVSKGAVVVTSENFSSTKKTWGVDIISIDVRNTGIPMRNRIEVYGDGVLSYIDANSPVLEPSGEVNPYYNPTAVENYTTRMELIDDRTIVSQEIADSTAKAEMGRLVNLEREVRIKVIGDGTLIQGKLFQFSDGGITGLGGTYKITSALHNVNPDGGFTTTVGLRNLTMTTSSKLYSDILKQSAKGESGGQTLKESRPAQPALGTVVTP